MPVSVPNPAPIPPQPILQEHASHNGHQDDLSGKIYIIFLPDSFSLLLHVLFFFLGNLSIPLTVSDSSCGETDIAAQEFDSEIETVAPQPAATVAPPAPVHEPGDDAHYK